MDGKGAAEWVSRKTYFCRKSLIAFGVTKIASFLVMNEKANANSTIESHIECHLRISERKIYGKSKITQPSSCGLRADGGDGMPSSCTFMRCRLHIMLMLAHLSLFQYFHSHCAAILICVCVFCLPGMEKNACRRRSCTLPVRKCFGVIRQIENATNTYDCCCCPAVAYNYLRNKKLPAQLHQMTIKWEIYTARDMLRLSGWYAMAWDLHVCVGIFAVAGRAQLYYSLIENAQKKKMKKTTKT